MHAAGSWADPAALQLKRTGCRQHFRGPTSLLFDLEIHDDSEQTSVSRSTELLDELIEQVSEYCEPRNSFETELAQDVSAFKALVLAEEGRQDIVVLASKLAAVGYRVSLRTAVGGGAGQEAFRNLHHEFLLITRSDVHTTQYLVDPNFREQFTITARDGTYENLLAAVPAEFVGTKEQLMPLVQLLCSEMAAAFSTCSVCPPWRTYRSMLSKWIPAKVKDLAMCPDLGGVSPTSTLTPPGDSPPYPFGTPSFPAYRLPCKGGPEQQLEQLEPSLRAHSADLAPVPTGPPARDLQQAQSQPADRAPSPRPGCVSLSPAQTRQGFKIEAVGGSRHGSPATSRPVGFLWQGGRDSPKGSVRGGMQPGAVDVTPRLQRHSWQHPPMRTVKMTGAQRVR